MPDFLEPESVSDAVSLLAEDPYGRKAIAGGTAIALMLTQKLIMPDALVSLGRIPALNTIEVADDELRIGALTTLTDIAASPLVQRVTPALANACAVVGNIRVRNQATLGGNLAEADYASDPPAVLLALDASVDVQGTEGKRTIPLSEFLLGFYTTALQPDEIITAIRIPALPDDARMTYLKYRSRSSEDRPCVGVAAVAQFDGDLCRDLRVSVGAASPTPQRLPNVEAEAAGKLLTAYLITHIAESYASDMDDPLDDLRGSAWYRRQMIRVHVRRALEEVRDGAR